MLFFYIRHGDPIYNPDSLTPLGRRQAEALGKRLAVTAWTRFMLRRLSVRRKLRRRPVSC